MSKLLFPSPPSIPILDGYLLRQVVSVFLFSVGLLASLGVAIGNLSDVMNKVVEANLPLTLALEILLLKLPEFLSYSLPISLLLTTLMTYGRLTKDSEIIALRSCGVSLYRLLLPTLLFSFLITGTTFLITELAVPAANYRVTEILVTAINEQHDFWQNQDIFYPNYEDIILPDGQPSRKLRSLFYAEKFDGKEMHSLTILQWVEASLNQIVVSDSAVWNPGENTWDFYNGTIYTIDDDSSYSEALSFTHRQLPLPKTVFDFAVQGRNPYEMNIEQAHRYAEIIRLSGDEKKLRLFLVRIQQKIAFPFLCIILTIIGMALGCVPQRMSRGASFSISVGIVFAYYLINFISGSMGLTGVLTPFWAAWLPNFLGLGIGLFLLWKVNG
jgi:lipopolysaccharide export system permease protein